MLDGVKKSGGEKVIGLLENALPHKAIKNIYNASWHIAWKLDETVRMASYRYLMEKGFSPREAAQNAAKFHSDYASVPATTRRTLNHIFFTPTFKITMGKLYAKMISDAVKSVYKLGKVDKTTALYGKGLIATFGILEGWDLFMRAQGFECDEWGRRYIKRVETDEGEKELVVTWSSPANMFQKYYYRAKAALQPEVEKPLVRFFESNKWEIHPLYRVGYEIANNDNGIGDKVYSDFDTPTVKAGKSLKHAIGGTIQLLGLLDREESNKEAQERFKKESGQLLDLATRPFTFKYMRSVEERRVGYKLSAVRKRFESELRRGNIKPEHFDQYIKQINDILGGLEK